MGASFLGGVDEKILQGPEQERTEPPAIAVSVLEPVISQYCREKILRQILRVFYGIAASADKRENGSPVSAAQLGQRIVRFLFFLSQIGGREDQAPAGSYKRARFASALFARASV